jgi:sec-independent protein translocase protein TatC
MQHRLKQLFRSRKAEMPFLDHLEELRWRMITALVAVAVGTGIGFFLVTQFDVLGLLVDPIQPYLGDDKLKYLSPLDPFFITLQLALMTGVLLAFPIIVHQAWAFFSPALTPSERRTIVPSLYFGLVLFVGGMAVAYFFVIPLALGFSMGFQQDSLEQSIIVGAYLAVVIRLMLAFGIVFELPVVILILSLLGIVTPEFLTKNRRFAFAGITVLACLLTPGDVNSSIMMMVPLFVLYEVSIVLSRIVVRRRAAATAALSG